MLALFFFLSFGNLPLLITENKTNATLVRNSLLLSYTYHLQKKTKQNKTKQKNSMMIKLNVGGTVYATSSMTLCRYPDSMLARTMDGDIPTRSEWVVRVNERSERPSGPLKTRLSPSRNAPIVTCVDNWRMENLCQIKCGFPNWGNSIYQFASIFKNGRWRNSSGARLRTHFAVPIQIVRKYYYF